MIELNCYARLVGNLEEVELIAQAADKAFEDASGTGRIQGNAMTRAALVLLCGYFEGFVRDIAEEYVDILNDEGVHLDAFPEQVFCAVVENMATTLRNGNGAVGNFKLAMRPAVAVPLSKKLFSNTGGNPSVDTIEAVFNGLGLPRVIDTLSIADFQVDSTFVRESQVLPKMREEIQAAILSRNADDPAAILDDIVGLIEQRWSPKQKRRKVGYVNEIEQLLKKRNRIAHGEGNEQITTTDLRGFLLNIGKLADGLHKLAGALLHSLTSPPAPV